MQCDVKMCQKMPGSWKIARKAVDERERQKDNEIRLRKWFRGVPWSRLLVDDRLSGHVSEGAPFAPTLATGALSHLLAKLTQTDKVAANAFALGDPTEQKNKNTKPVWGLSTNQRTQHSPPTLVNHERGRQKTFVAHDLFNAKGGAGVDYQQAKVAFLQGLEWTIAKDKETRRREQNSRCLSHADIDEKLKPKNRRERN